MENDKIGVLYSGDIVINTTLEKLKEWDSKGSDYLDNYEEEEDELNGEEYQYRIDDSDVLPLEDLHFFEPKGHFIRLETVNIMDEDDKIIADAFWLQTNFKVPDEFSEYILNEEEEDEHTIDKVIENNYEINFNKGLKGGALKKDSELIKEIKDGLDSGEFDIYVNQEYLFRLEKVDFNEIIKGKLPL